MSWTKINTLKFENTPADVFQNGPLKVIISRDPPGERWHLSISHPQRYPTWDEIKRARYEFIPDAVTMAMMLPPKAEYVNVHQNCFHLHEWRDREVILV